MRRCAFTLVDLLVAIAIIGILAAVTLGAVSAARESARKEATRATITKLHYLIAERVEAYRTKRLPVDTSGMSPTQRALAIINARRDLMRLDMPDRFTDITQGPLFLYPQPTRTMQVRSVLTGELITETVTASRDSSLAQRYQRIFYANTKRTDSNAAAECLYMIISAIPDAMEKFTEREIGDADDDGFPEFVDAWGHPIRFIRWPAGFIPPDAQSSLQDGTAPDPNDPLGLIGEYKTFPLIYSAGPDGIYDINRGIDAAGKTMSYVIGASGNVETVVRDSQTNLIGAPLDGSTLSGEPNNGALDHHDNITNHDLNL